MAKKIRHDKPRLIERILNNNDPKQNKALDTILQKHGFTVKIVLESIDEDRKLRNLEGWA
jgi:hypothetical protein